MSFRSIFFGIICLLMTLNCIEVRISIAKNLNTVKNDIKSEKLDLLNFNNTIGDLISEFRVSPHPRLMIDRQKKVELRAKLSDYVYEEDLSHLSKMTRSGNLLSNAFLYNIFGDQIAGQIAKTILFSGNYPDVKGYEQAADWIVPVIAYDWIFDLLDHSERIHIYRLLKKQFDYSYMLNEDSKDQTSWFWNDTWARHKPLFAPMLAIVMYDEGIDNPWARDIVRLASQGSNLVSGPFSTETISGFMDILNIISLEDGGGEQVGIHTKVGGGYYSMFLHSFLPLAVWSNLISRDLWSICPFYQELPHYWAYLDLPPSDLGLATLEYITGIYKTRDPETASLARWFLEKYGRSKYHLVFRLLYGDLRIKSKSPEELNLETTRYFKGGDLFSSHSSWDDPRKLKLKVYSRYLDTNRYEPYSGVYSLYKGDKPLLIGGRGLKTKPSNGTYSGLWIYDPSTLRHGQGSTYWGRKSFGNRKEARRAYNAHDVLSKDVYFPGGPDFWEANSEYRAITQEYSKLAAVSPVESMRNTIIFIPGEKRSFLVVYDYAKIGKNLKAVNSMRLAEVPEVRKRSFSIEGMTVTSVSPDDMDIYWVGGADNEKRSPEPEKIWYGNKKGGYKPGYSKDPVKVKNAGLGNVYFQPRKQSKSYDFLSVIEIGDGEPVQIKKISSTKVAFDKWMVSFKPDGAYSVEKDGVNVGSWSPK